MIEAIKEVLKGIDQTELESTDGWWETSAGAEFGAKKLKYILDLLAQPEQEPVAWRETHSKVIKALAAIVTVHTPDKLFDLDAIPRDPVMQLVQQIRSAIDGYKPPQRTWVGLTDEEIDSCFEDHGWSPSEDYYPVIKAIEAKLKQKNGYAEEKNT